jgi:hypothetical protein
VDRTVVKAQENNVVTTAIHHCRRFANNTSAMIRLQHDPASVQMAREILANPASSTNSMSVEKAREVVATNDFFANDTVTLGYTVDACVASAMLAEQAFAKCDPAEYDQAERFLADKQDALNVAKAALEKAKLKYV